MNCNPENRNAYLVAKMLGWRELAQYGFEKYERARARRNLRRLADAHPDIAVDCGLGQLVDLSGTGIEFQIPGLDR